ncbi:MAG TPA: GNAT family N-acetyltransferase [Flavobacterium sp.]|uniref:GNAT family N-acetyltransferase n=1 Tax=unclassified Flavobacterium TaxID=196869 RepID=UPI000E975D27|nr:MULTISPECIES: GNAT family N-acetyltransferase [unclassified Flavobacterium]HBI01571.1 GNAT family N-acetyltransferase [Flavobacterium sp.]HRE77309.1 GNAT family N-acetyltransferase [Flavobacterium sp.]
MSTLQGKQVYLRALEPEDLEFIYRLENDTSVWEVSQTQTPYSMFLIKSYLENAHKDIYEAKQLRLAICKNETFEAIGLIDLFDFDPKNSRAGIGIVIQNPEDRSLGFGKEALELLIAYAKNYLHIHQLFANISVTNLASKTLFTSFGFELIGIKKDWIFSDGNYSDEAFYQLIIKK